MASSAAATAAAAAEAKLRTQCERTVVQERAQAAARLEEAEKRHNAGLLQAQQEASRRIERLEAARLAATTAARQEAADRQVWRCCDEVTVKSCLLSCSGPAQHSKGASGRNVIAGSMSQQQAAQLNTP